MTELLTAAQMRAIEAAAIASGEVTGLELMERAGQGVVEAIFAEWPELGDGGGAAPVPPGYLGTENSGARRAVVLCGPGGNGGDGFVVARLLRERGWAVTAVALGDSVTADAAAMRSRWPGAVRAPDALGWPDVRSAALVVDAMFGTGLARPVAPGVWGLLEMAKAAGCRLVAVDILSGLCADSGKVRSEGGYAAWPADLTVTFQSAKLGHCLEPGAAMSGRLRVVPLGLDRALDALRRRDATLVARVRVAGSDLAKRAGHKFAHGHALVLSGPSGQGGAARLAARGALRIGAGLVTVGCPPEALAENAGRLDAVMLREVRDGAALREALEDERISALCLGPGLGLEARATGLVGEALRVSRSRVKPGTAGGLGVVLDADALTALSRDAALFAMLHDGCVLTPHGGEFARLFPDIAAKLEAPATSGPAHSKVDACREAAKRAGCVVLFKGPDTVIAHPDGRCSINSAHYERAAPWLATAGSGDVLAGFITGLLARGFAPMQAAGTAAWLHVDCALGFGPGLIAEDLPEELPKVFRALGVQAARASRMAMSMSESSAGPVTDSL